MSNYLTSLGGSLLFFSFKAKSGTELFITLVLRLRGLRRPTVANCIRLRGDMLGQEFRKPPRLGSVRLLRPLGLFARIDAGNVGFTGALRLIVACVGETSPNLTIL